MFRNHLLGHASYLPFRAPDGDGGGAPAGGDGKKPDAPPTQTVRIKVETDQPGKPSGGDGDGDGTRRGKPTEAELRAEAAAYRIELRKKEEEAERLTRERDEAKAGADKRVQDEVGKVTARVAKLQEKVLNSELKAAAVAAGLEDLDLLPLIDRSGIKVDDELNVTGLAEALTAFKEKKPNFFKGSAKTPDGDGKPAGDKKPAVTGDGKTPPPDPNAKTDITKMSKADYEAWKRDNLRKMRRIA